MSRLRTFFSERLSLSEYVLLYFMVAVGIIILDVTLHFPLTLSKEIPKLTFGKMGIYMIIVPIIIIIVSGIIGGIIDYVSRMKEEKSKKMNK